MRTTHAVLAALVALPAVSGCGLRADQLTVAAPAPASASASHAAPAPSTSPAAPGVETSAAPAPPPTPPAPSPAASPRTGPCAPRPPAAASVSLQTSLSFPAPVVTPRTRGTLTVRNVGTRPVHVSGRDHVGIATVDGDALTSTAAGTSDYVPPVELRPGEQRSYRVALVGHQCPGGHADWDRPLPSGHYQVVALLDVQEVEGLTVRSEPVDVQYEAEG